MGKQRSKRVTMRDVVRAAHDAGMTVDFKAEPAPIPMLLWCPECGARHIDVGAFATKVHRDHACQYCGMVWRPALVPTVGVQFLPGCEQFALGDPK